MRWSWVMGGLAVLAAGMLWALSGRTQVGPEVFLLLLGVIGGLARPLGEWITHTFADWFVDTIYSARGTADSVPLDDEERQRQLRVSWKLVSAGFYVLMAAALAGLVWGWSGFRAFFALEPTDGLPAGVALPAAAFVLSALAWAVYFFGYFLPTWWAHVDAAYVRWRYGDPEPYDYDGSAKRESRARIRAEALAARHARRAERAREAARALPTSRDERNTQDRDSLWQR